MKIEEVVELILFNLTVYQNKRFYDVLRVIVPYARDNWSALQLSPNVSVRFVCEYWLIVFFLSGVHVCQQCGLSERFLEMGPSENNPFSFVLDEEHELRGYS